MNNGAIYLGVASVLAAAAYILSTRNVEAEDMGAQTGGSNAANEGTGFAINNPGNIRFIADSKRAFNGQVGNSQGYGIYDSLANGVRAMGMVLQSYYNAGCRSITDFVTKYAPRSENPTAAYIASVSGTTTGNPFALNIAPTRPLDWPADKLDLVMAMIYQENGRNPLALSDVQAWLLS